MKEAKRILIVSNSVIGARLPVSSPDVATFVQFDQPRNQASLRALCDALADNVHCLLIDENISDPSGRVGSYFGFDFACELRRNYLVTTPLAIFGQLSNADRQKLRKVNRNLDILEGQGAGYVQFPFLFEQIDRLLSRSTALLPAELRDVVINHTDFWGAWAQTVHLLQRHAQKIDSSSEELVQEFARWDRPILKFWPTHSRKLTELKTAFLEDPEISAEHRLVALQDFDSLLTAGTPKGAQTDQRLPLVVPKCPPRGFSKVLIADDNFQDYLIATLRTEYRYDLITPQATKLSQAKNRLDEDEPAVVLADLYFKTSDRVTEVPNKAAGEEFIKYAIRAKHKPLVLVTSKARIRAEDLLVGTFDCSGSHRATNASAVHERIWAAAATRGVTEPEVIDDQCWGPELLARQRLDPYKALLPKLIDQWASFGSLIQETLNLSKLLSKDNVDHSDEELIDDLVCVLESANCQVDFAMAGAETLFRDTDDIHRRARLGPDSTTKTRIRNVLHGKIQQFSSIRNAVQQLLLVTKEVGTDLEATPDLACLGSKLSALRNQYTSTTNVAGFLRGLRTLIDEILKTLPQMPLRKDPVQKVVKNPQPIRIIVVEDDPYWTSQIESVIQHVTDLYGSKYEITFELFDNTEDALSQLEPRRNTHAISDVVNSMPTLAILDICVPKDPTHVEKIRVAASGTGRSFESPDSSNGLNLIRTLTEFRYNLPLIVFSTIASVSDRKKVCGWGVPEDNFIAKGTNADEHLTRALIRFIERSNRYVISRHLEPDQIDEDGKYHFRINGIKIDFPPALFETFSSLFDLCQRTHQRAFTFAEILENQGKPVTEESLRILQDHMNRIRNKIFETAHRNRVYVDIHGLLRTRTEEENGDGDYAYELNAEIPSEDDEYVDARSEDIDGLRSRNRALVVDDSEADAEIAELLASKGFEVEVATTSEEAIRIATQASPDIVIIAESAVPDAITLWNSLRNSLIGRDMGVVVTSNHHIALNLANDAVQAGIPLENLISRSSSNWLNLLFQALDNERLRVFVGDAADLSTDLAFPIVEILDGTDIGTGVVEVAVNEKPFHMRPRKNGNLSQIMARLLISPAETLSWENIRSHTGLSHPPSENDRKMWTKRLRERIADEWLDSEVATERSAKAKLVLESSSEGLRLNVRTLDLRTKS